MPRRRPDPERALARKAKRAGISKAEYLTKREAVTNAAARLQSWRPSERAAALAELDEIANEIWGDDAAQNRP